VGSRFFLEHIFWTPCEKTTNFQSATKLVFFEPTIDSHEDWKYISGKNLQCLLLECNQIRCSYLNELHSWNCLNKYVCECFLLLKKIVLVWWKWQLEDDFKLSIHVHFKHYMNKLSIFNPKKDIESKIWPMNDF